jgi:hypothetical protein
MNRQLANFFEWVIEAPAWVRTAIALLFAAAGFGTCVLCGHLGIYEGGKFGGILIGVGLVLFAADVFV